MRRGQNHRQNDHQNQDGPEEGQGDRGNDRNQPVSGGDEAERHRESIRTSFRLCKREAGNQYDQADWQGPQPRTLNEEEIHDNDDQHADRGNDPVEPDEGRHHGIIATRLDAPSEICHRRTVGHRRLIGFLSFVGNFLPLRAPKIAYKREFVRLAGVSGLVLAADPKRVVQIERQNQSRQTRLTGDSAYRPGVFDGYF